MILDAHLARGADAQTLWLSEVVAVAQRTVEILNRQSRGGIADADEALLVPPLSMRPSLHGQPQDTLDGLYAHHLTELQEQARGKSHGRASTPTRGERVAATLMFGGLGIPQIDREYEHTLRMAEEIRKGQMPLAFGNGSIKGFAEYTKVCLSLREPSDRPVAFETKHEVVNATINGRGYQGSTPIRSVDPLAYVSRRIEVWQRRMEHASDSSWNALGIYALPPHMLMDPYGTVRAAAMASYVTGLVTGSFARDPADCSTTAECIEAARLLLRCFCTNVPELLVASQDFDAMHDGLIVHMRVSTSTDATRSMTSGETIKLMEAVARRLRPRPA